MEKDMIKIKDFNIIILILLINIKKKIIQMNMIFNYQNQNKIKKINYMLIINC